MSVIYSKKRETERKFSPPLIWDKLSSGRVQDALQECLTLIAKRPKDYTLQIQAAEIHLKLGQKSEAIQCFRKAANLCHAAGHMRKAVALLMRIIKLDPAIEEIYFCLESIYRSEGLKNEAKLQLWSFIRQTQNSRVHAGTVRAYYKLIELDPENLSLRLEACETLKNLGMIQDLRNQYSEMSVYADFFISKGRLSEAQAWLQALKAGDPLDPEHQARLDLVQQLEEQRVARAS